MSGIFKDMVGTTVEVHVDDIVVKSRSLEKHPDDIQKIFDVLEKAGIKLNLKKCTFRVKAGKFLRYIVLKEV